MININTTLIIQLVNFLLLMFLLNRLLFRPMTRLLTERAERTDGRQRDAARLASEADAILASYQKSLRQAKSQADEVRAVLQKEGEAQRQKLLDAAATEAEGTLTQIRARVRAEAEEARKALRLDAEKLAAQAAQQILGRAV